MSIRTLYCSQSPRYRQQAARTRPRGLFVRATLTFITAGGRVNVLAHTGLVPTDLNAKESHEGGGWWKTKEGHQNRP